MSLCRQRPALIFHDGPSCGVQAGNRLSPAYVQSGMHKTEHDAIRAKGVTLTTRPS
jgi:hypothetical protein